MEIDLANMEVNNNQSAQRYEVQLDGGLAMIEYRLADQRIIFTHAEVPPAFQGQGIAQKMAHIALEDARAHQQKVVPLCPFVAQYIRQHPEYQDLVDSASGA